jgi:hypothetical protein
MAIQRRYNEPTGRPATLGSTLKADLDLIVWCKACRHRVEPDVAEQVARYGADLTLLDWQERLVCSRCGGRDIDFVVSGSGREKRPHTAG